MNSTFSKQADELLTQDVELVGKIARTARSEEEARTIRQMDAALQAYIVSWRVVQDLFAEEAKTFEESINPGARAIATAVAKIRAGALSDQKLDAVGLSAYVSDEFGAAAQAAGRFRTTHDKADVAAIETAVNGITTKLGTLVPMLGSTSQNDISSTNKLLAVWIAAVRQAAKVADTRATRIDSWTKNEGEVMTATASQLVDINEQSSKAAETTFASAVSGSKITLLSCVGLIFAAGLALSALLARSITTPLLRLTKVMGALAARDTSVTLAEADRGDEIGAMARSVGVFRDSMIETERLSHAKALESEQQIRRAHKLNDLTKQFETTVGAIVETVSTASVQLEQAAGTLTATAENTQQLSGKVASASKEASINVQTVASASEEMTSSVAEIARQVHDSSKIAAEAVKQAEETDVRITDLSRAATRIGDVVKLITAIAEQTNLLALNATIEAARAGEAGRGFAVVAQEVKALASQTAKATDEIGNQITGMQSATQQSVAAIKGIGATITRVSQIASTIAAAVEEQGAATREIARNVQLAAHGTSQVAANITDVNRGAENTGTASAQVLSSAKSLSNESGRLRTEVERFLSTVRIA
jgi:methyl-accepting chemotaxis protein